MEWKSTETPVLSSVWPFDRFSRSGTGSQLCDRKSRMDLFGLSNERTPTHSGSGRTSVSAFNDENHSPCDLRLSLKPLHSYQNDLSPDSRLIRGASEIVSVS